MNNLFEIKFTYPANVNGKDKVLSGKVGISGSELTMSAVAVSQLLERYFPSNEFTDESTGEFKRVGNFEIIGAAKVSYDFIKTFDGENAVWYAAKCVELIEEKKVATVFVVLGNPNNIYNEVKAEFYDATTTKYREFVIDSHKPLNWLELLDINDSVIPYFENKEVEDIEGE